MTSTTIPPEDEERRRHLLHLVWRLRNGNAFKVLPSIEFDEINQVAAELEQIASQPDSDREAIIEADNGWLPIETAPRERGKPLLLWYAHPRFNSRDHRACIGWWAEDVSGWDIGGCVVDHITKWQRLPGSPRFLKHSDTTSNGGKNG